VGFRPYIHGLANALSLSGWVGNDERGVFIELEGSLKALERFQIRLPNELPPLARLNTLEIEEIPCLGDANFFIQTSRRSGQAEAEISPDAASCSQCLAELIDPEDRRFGYPFLNCTHCGPRYSIIRDRPYDRPRTSMAGFPLCFACRAEYEEPLDRRFHAQPTACARCGPRLSFCDRDGQLLPGEIIPQAIQYLEQGKILGIKGLGGFHLVCRADEEAVVLKLRARKAREARPFALMLRDLKAVSRLVQLPPGAASLLESSAAPILLLPRHPGASVAQAVAPGQARLGVMLPYTPLHQLILAQISFPLVVTSGNLSAEPLCYRNEEALSRLKELVDAFLLHDRPIERAVDDSVLLWGEPPTLIRRARGFVPEPIPVDLHPEHPILALGPEMKSTLCLLYKGEALVSEHLGTLSNPAAWRTFLQIKEEFPRLFELEPGALAVDLHPDYSASRCAPELGLPIYRVQHHHAHMAACLAENGHQGPALGIIADGAGYGLDGTVWGGEILQGDHSGFLRRAWLRPFMLPGGDAAARSPWRLALSLLHELKMEPREAPLLSLPSPLQLPPIRFLLQRERAPRCSSLGRLFDGVAALLGICQENRFEAEAAMLLEAAALDAEAAEPLPWKLSETKEELILDWRPMIKALLRRSQAAESPKALALAFHLAVAEIFAEAGQRIAGREGLKHIALSGGCFANQILRDRLRDLLEARGLIPLLHRRVPPGDGGISLGQAVVAAAQERSAYVSGRARSGDQPSR